MATVSTTKVEDPNAHLKWRDISPEELAYEKEVHKITGICAAALAVVTVLLIGMNYGGVFTASLKGQAGIYVAGSLTGLGALICGGFAVGYNHASWVRRADLTSPWNPRGYWRSQRYHTLVAFANGVIKQPWATTRSFFYDHDYFQVRQYSLESLVHKEMMPVKVADGIRDIFDTYEKNLASIRAADAGMRTLANNNGVAIETFVTSKLPTAEAKAEFRAFKAQKEAAEASNKTDVEEVWNAATAKWRD